MAKVVKISQEVEQAKEEFEKVEVKGGGLSIKFKFNKRHLIIIAVVIILALIPSLYFYNQYQTTKNLLQDPKTQTTAETKALVDEVGKLIDLPTNEQPKLATVTDVTQLAGQPFFAKAKNGDKVLIYAVTGKAILYRESINKIIEVAPVNTSVGNTQTQQISPSPTQNQLQTATATILNGTLKSGLASYARDKFYATENFIDVVGNVKFQTVGDSVNGNYSETLVIDVNGKNTALVNNIAKLLNAKVETTIPQGEKQPNTDILIILGNNYTK